MAVTCPHSNPWPHGAVVVGEGAFFETGGRGLVVGVGCLFRVGAVVLTVPTGPAVGTVVVDALAVPELDAARGLLQAASTTARDAVKTRTIERLRRDGCIVGPWLCGPGKG
jgi:hypothetical protein